MLVSMLTCLNYCLGGGGSWEVSNLCSMPVDLFYYYVPWLHHCRPCKVFPQIDFALELYLLSNSICSIFPYKWNNDRPWIVFAVSVCAVYAKSTCSLRSILHFQTNCWGVSSPWWRWQQSLLNFRWWLRWVGGKRTQCFLYVTTCGSHAWAWPFKLHYWT